MLMHPLNDALFRYDYGEFYNRNGEGKKEGKGEWVKYSINKNCLKQAQNVITKPNIQNYTHISNEISVPQTRINEPFTALKCVKSEEEEEIFSLRSLSCKSGIQNKHDHKES